MATCCWWLLYRPTQVWSSNSSSVYLACNLSKLFNFPQSQFLQMWDGENNVPLPHCPKWLKESSMWKGEVHWVVKGKALYLSGAQQMEAAIWIPVTAMAEGTPRLREIGEPVWVTWLVHAEEDLRLLFSLPQWFSHYQVKRGLQNPICALWIVCALKNESPPYVFD